jgi:hypothetical protein
LKLLLKVKKLGLINNKATTSKKVKSHRGSITQESAASHGTIPQTTHLETKTGGELIPSTPSRICS